MVSRSRRRVIAFPMNGTCSPIRYPMGRMPVPSRTSQRIAHIGGSKVSSIRQVSGISSPPRVDEKPTYRVVVSLGSFLHGLDRLWRLLPLQLLKVQHALKVRGAGLKLRL